MLNLSNVLSLSRAALALCFLQESPLFRFIAILCAMISDFLDGFIARRSGTASQFGAILDPIMDKFFVFFAGGILYLERSFTGADLLMLLSRDISLCLFGIYLVCVQGWKDYECKAIFWGKLTTTAQFILLCGVTLHIVFPKYLYFLFILMATCAFGELFAGYRREKQEPIEP